MRLKIFLKFFKFLTPLKRQYFTIIALSLAAAIVSAATPYVSKLVIDEGLSKKDLSVFIAFTLLGAGLFILSELLSAAEGFLSRYIKIKVNFYLNRSLFKHLQNFSLNWFQDRAAGEHLYKLSYDLDTITDFLTNTLPQAALVLPRLLFTLTVLFLINWKLAALSLLLAPFLYLPSYYFNRKMQKNWESLVKNSEDIFKHLEEKFSHIQVIKIFAKEASSVRNYINLLIANIRLRIKSSRLEVLFNSLGNAANKLALGMISLYGGYQVIKGNLTLGGLTAAMIYLYQLTGVGEQIHSLFQTITLGTISCQRVGDILDEKPLIVELPGARNFVASLGEVTFEGVSFSYQTEKFVLKNINFKFPAGKHISLVGYSGCGKTTLLNLIVRMYDPLEGRIIIDGRDIKEMKLSSLRQQVGFALQEPFLWNDTIENNIRYGKETASVEEVLKAARISTVDEFAKDLPQGYKTIIGENACKISEGQKQKIAIARALIKWPKILILDEAMSSMDSASEEKIISSIKREYNGLTLVVVSHRLSTVMQADSVYYLRGPNEMIIDNAQNLLSVNQELSRLFAGQEGILSRQI